MSETAINKSFFEVFPEVVPDAAVSDFFREVRIENLGIYRKTGKLAIKASAGRLIPAQTIERMEATLSEAFSLTVEIKVRFETDSPLPDVLEEYRKAYCIRSVQKSYRAKAYLTDAVGGSKAAASS